LQSPKALGRNRVADTADIGNRRALGEWKEAVASRHAIHRSPDAAFIGRVNAAQRDRNVPLAVRRF
jgi:hypothetical protein